MSNNFNESGFVMFVSNGVKDFLYWPSYGPTESICRRNMRNANARRTARSRPELEVHGIASVTLTMDALHRYPDTHAWRHIEPQTA